MAAEEDVTNYRPPPTPWMLRLRSTEEFRAELEDVVRLWKVHADARGDDADKIDLAHVVRAILEAGVSGAFANYGGHPKTDAEWAAIEKAIRQGVASAKR